MMGRRRVKSRQVKKNVGVDTANMRLAAALGHALALINEVLNVESWEAFEKKRDEVRAVLDKPMRELMAHSEGARDAGDDPGAAGE